MFARKTRKAFMKMSKDRFQRLVSLYIDAEASPEEAQELFDCINSDSSARAFFLRCCAIHKTMCKLYGKEASFAKLASLDVESLLANKKPTTFKIVAEWAVVAMLFAVCMGTMAFAIPQNDSITSQIENKNDKNSNYDVEITQQIQVGDGEIAIIKIYPTRPLLEIDR